MQVHIWCGWVRFLFAPCPGLPVISHHMCCMDAVRTLQCNLVWPSCSHNMSMLQAMLHTCNWCYVLPNLYYFDYCLKTSMLHTLTAVWRCLGYKQILRHTHFALQWWPNHRLRCHLAVWLHWESWQGGHNRGASCVESKLTCLFQQQEETPVFCATSRGAWAQIQEKAWGRVAETKGGDLLPCSFDIISDVACSAAQHETHDSAAGTLWVYPMQMTTEVLRLLPANGTHKSVL